MLDNIHLFWDFFFYPLYQMDQSGLFYDVVAVVVISYCVFWFIREVLVCL